MVRGRTLALGGLLAFTLLAVSSPLGASALQGTQCEGAQTPVRKANIAASERTLLCLLNLHRVANGRQVLTHDPALLAAARSHSRYMETTGQFAHQDIGDGTPQERANAFGYPFAVGENIARAPIPSTPSDMLAIFIASPAHNANLLDPTSPAGSRIIYRTAGMGFAVGPTYGVSVTQMFGVGDNGATDTAADLLTSTACEDAESGLAAAERAVAKAKRKLRRAETAQERARARKRLKNAKAALAAAKNAEEIECTLTY